MCESLYLVREPAVMVLETAMRLIAATSMVPTQAFGMNEGNQPTKRRAQSSSGGIEMCRVTEVIGDGF